MYSLKTQARCLVAHAGDEERHAFLVGTANLRGPNEVRLLRYYAEDEELSCAAVWAHEGPVTALAACPTDAALLLTSTISPSGAPSAAVWRLRDLPGDAGPGGRHSEAAVDAGEATRELECVATVPAASGGARLLCVQWVPGGGDDASPSAPAPPPRLLAIDETSLRLFELRDGGALATVTELPLGDDVGFVGGVSWDALHPTDVAVACDAAIHVWDTRARARTRSIERAVPPGCCVRAVSFNSNKPWHLASGGDDYKVKVWDLRRPATPVKILDGHTHWVTAVAFNAFHDQLVLSGGTDGRVNLWSVSSVSSAPLLELGDEEIFGADGSGGVRKNEPKLAADVAIRSHEEHDDSVYAAAWSAHTAWVYASLSYQGKVVVAQVPAATKYKILL